MIDTHSAVDQMLASGLQCPPLPLRVDGALHRFGPKKASWYRLRELRTASGRYVVVGSFGCWKLGVSQRVEVDWAGISAAEREALRAAQTAQDEARRQSRAIEADQAAMTAQQLWRQGMSTGCSDYLARKGVRGEGCRYLVDGSLLVPLLRYDLPREQALRAVQRIWPDGRKRFTRGFEKPGCALRLGAPVVVGEPILLCEGYATALTLCEATGGTVPVFMAIDAGNLLPVAQMLRDLFGASRLLICADDDYRTRGPDGALCNVGRLKALAAARKVVLADVVYPIWPAGAARGEKDTDFNDLHRGCSIEVVRHQVQWVLQMMKRARRAA